jgi:integrase/recombinase XerD
MTELVDALGRRRSPATLPGFRRGRPNGNLGKRFPPETLSPAEIMLLIDGQARASASGLRHRALIALLWRSGLRIQEALDLEIRDLNFGAATIHVRRGKGDKARRVVMDPFGWEYIAPWLAKRAELQGVNPDHGLVFCVTDGPTKGGPLGSPHVRTMLKQTAKQAGMTRRVAPHLFRHTMACEMFDEGIDLRVIQRQLGHTSLAVTDRYVNHLSPKAQYEAITVRPAPVAA